MRSDDIDSILDYYDDCLSVRATAAHFGLSHQRIRKILLTFGNYKCSRSLEIRAYLDEGKSIPEIAELLNIAPKTVQSFMPYVKGMYKLDDATENALRIRKCRHKEE